ncbi:MAG: hypothetical protein QNL88_15185 [Acidobacteriota bacterium]|nr:hypothetical protein [Acidobacteriota bacterium]
MRYAALILLLVFSGCGGRSGTEPDSDPAGTSHQRSNEAESSPDSAIAMAAADFDTPATVAPEIAEAWSGVRIRVVDRDGGGEETFDIPLNGADLLGDSGLVLSAGVFLPDFILDEDGISSRSTEPINPAVRVVISEDGMEDYEGWLFASMPEIRPYPHTRFEVLLVEGIPAG